MLDNYFVPKVNVPFERHLFRKMYQVASGVASGPAVAGTRNFKKK